MMRLFLAAGVAALAITAPANADKGRGANKGGQQVAKVDRGGGGQRAQMKMHRGGADRVQARSMRRVERAQARVERRGGERRMAALTRGERDEARAVKVERKAVRQQQANRIERKQMRADRQALRVDRKALRADRGDQRISRQALRSQRMENRIDRKALREQRVANRMDWDDDDRFVNGRRVGFGGINCPPGLAAKDNGCMPPGQLKNRMMGQILPAQYSKNAMPLSLRRLYPDTDDYYYRYGDGYAYRVNRETNLVASLLPLLGGGYTVGQMFPTSYMNSYVPDYYRSFYPDTSDDYYRYANGYVYEIDRDSGYIEDMIPMYGYGYGVGQMMPASYSYYNLPYQYRDMYSDTDDYYYRYAPGAIYQVDRGSNLISAVASLLTSGFAVGQPLPMGYDAYNVPYDYRAQYYDTPDAWYRYNNGNIYQVDPTTRLITAIVRAIV